MNKMQESKFGQTPEAQSDVTDEIRERWKQHRAILERSRRYPRQIVKHVYNKQQRYLDIGVQLIA